MSRSWRWECPWRGGVPWRAKVIGGAVGLLIGVALSWLASFLAGAVLPESAGWVQEEAGLWLSALLAVGVTAAWRAKQGIALTAV